MGSATGEEKTPVNLRIRQIGRVLVETDTGRLSRGSTRISLEPRVMEVLIHLLDANGQLVSRDTLIDAVWEGRPGADAALTTAISKLRRAFSELGSDVGKIRTVPKRGYQLVRPDGPSISPRIADKTAGSESSAAPPLERERVGDGPGGRALLLFTATALLAMLVLGISLFTGRSSPPSTVAGSYPVVRLGISPFVGMEGTEALGFGISDEIHARLAAHPDLQLVHLPFGSDPQNANVASVPVDYVVRGRVRPALTADGEDALNLSIRLDQVEEQITLWGEVLTVTDQVLFDAEQQIANRLVEAIPGLSPLPVPAQPVDVDPAAYRLYLQAIGALRRPLPVVSELQRAYFLLERVVQLDPDFSLGWAAMALVLSQQERWALESIDRTAWDALARAEALSPAHPEVLVARGEVQLAFGSEPGADGPVDFAAPFLDALAVQPGSVRALVGLARALQRRGQVSAALMLAESALAQAPDDGHVLRLAGRLNGATRRWGRAELLMERAAQLEPDQYLPWQARAEMRLMGTGDPAQALAVLGEAPAGMIPDKLWAEFRAYAGDPATTIERAQALIEQHGVGGFGVQWPVFALHAAHAFRQVGEEEISVEIAEASRNIYLRSISDSLDAWIGHSGLAYAEWLAGRPEEALKHGCLALRFRRERDALMPGMYEEFARIAALTGHLDLSRSLVEQLVRTDYGRTPLNVHALRLEPAWQPLREQPGFESWLETFPPPARSSEIPDPTRRIDLKAIREQAYAVVESIDGSAVEVLCSSLLDGD
jgi:DNA-binding winged helix-turn-helix (wHTH) protein/tetratricopeptide (TPR) repeat protein